MKSLLATSMMTVIVKMATIALLRIPYLNLDIVVVEMVFYGPSTHV